MFNTCKRVFGLRQGPGPHIYGYSTVSVIDHPEPPSVARGFRPPEWDSSPHALIPCAWETFAMFFALAMFLYILGLTLVWVVTLALGVPFVVIPVLQYAAAALAWCAHPPVVVMVVVVNGSL